jgi:RNA-binding protein 39
MPPIRPPPSNSSQVHKHTFTLPLRPSTGPADLMTDLASKIEDLLDEVAGETRAKKATPKGRDKDGDMRMESDAGSDRSSRRDKRSDARPRRRSPDRRDGGDYWEPKGRNRRSVSRDDDRWRPFPGSDRPVSRREQSDRDDYRDRDHDRGDRGHRSSRGYDRRHRRSASPRSRRPVKSMSPELNDDERDRRTIFVQQLAARLRTKELKEFFEKVGPVKEAQIVKDRVSGRSKGYVNFQITATSLMSPSVGYVEFRNEESVAAAIQLTGQKLLGIPIIAQHTEAEKNRQARTTEGVGPREPGVPIHRLYVGNIHFSITEDDLTNVFEPFGALEFVQLQKEEGTGRSRGYGFVQ